MNEINFQNLKKSAKSAALFLKTIGHPERLLILCQLINNEVNVGELWLNSSLSQSAFSQQLAVLKKKKLIKSRKKSQMVFYSLSDKNCVEILKLLHQLYC